MRLFLLNGANEMLLDAFMIEHGMGEGTVVFFELEDFYANLGDLLTTDNCIICLETPRNEFDEFFKFIEGNLRGVKIDVISFEDGESNDIYNIKNQQLTVIDTEFETEINKIRALIDVAQRIDILDNPQPMGAGYVEDGDEWKMKMSSQSTNESLQKLKTDLMNSMYVKLFKGLDRVNL